ncbi:hypothetical protein J2X46_002529 [Nocardioides sp. BE266]|uniref:FtsX-like permease family protein n=1 Tax=Nocardioides sp. BE266 TaxID=2817725 RepID=UPI002865EA7C|nr:FtsX-like permease family protein [Nocardioides sp. BE266]MDR7253539.1 hypothetical protein [Nocardioides sp. BE266]
MIELDLALGSFRGGGRARALAIGACTAVVTGLLLVAVTVAQYASADVRVMPDGTVVYLSSGGNVANLLRDGGVRPGYAFALLLICLVPLTLLQQVVRLGTAARERRLAALRLAGATPHQVRTVGAWEVGLPAVLGAVLGWPVYLALRALFGVSADTSWAGDMDVARELRMVPGDSPAWWQVVLVVLAVGLLGVLAGALASRTVVVSPLGVARGARRTPPRGWVPAVFVAAGLFLCGPVYVPFFEAWWAQLGGMVGIALLVLGLLSAAPWLAFRVGGALAGRTSSPSLLLASRWLVTDARAAGRAAAAIGVIALVSGGASSLLADLLRTSRSSDHGIDAMYSVPVALVFAVVLVALVVATFSLVVHGVESLTDRRRSLSSLAAEGVPVTVLENALRWEVGLAALPTSVLALVGVGVFGSLAMTGDFGAVVVQVGLSALTLALVWLALVASTRLVRPWLRRAADPANLRTT